MNTLYEVLERIESLVEPHLPITTNTFLLPTNVNVDQQFCVVTFSLVDVTNQSLCDGRVCNYQIIIYIVDSENANRKGLFANAELVKALLKEVILLDISETGLFLNNKEALQLRGTLQIGVV